MTSTECAPRTGEKTIDMIKFQYFRVQKSDFAATAHTNLLNSSTFAYRRAISLRLHTPVIC